MKRVLFILLLGTLLFSCRKAGPGGRAKLSVHVLTDSGKYVPNATVYVKYNATTSPGTNPNDYDKQQAIDYTGKTDFNNLKRGNYFFYAVGYDTASAKVLSGSLTYDIQDRNFEKDLVVIVK